LPCRSSALVRLVAESVTLTRRQGWHPDLDEAGARALVEQGMRVLFYRDTQTINRVVFAKVCRGAGGKAEVQIDAPVALRTDWGFQSFVASTSDEQGSW
jgi:hypothetical protein